MNKRIEEETNKSVEWLPRSLDLIFMKFFIKLHKNIIYTVKRFILFIPLRGFKNKNSKIVCQWKYMSIVCVNMFTNKKKSSILKFKKFWNFGNNTYALRNFFAVQIFFEAVKLIHENSIISWFYTIIHKI